MRAIVIAGACVLTLGALAGVALSGGFSFQTKNSFEVDHQGYAVIKGPITTSSTTFTGVFPPIGRLAVIQRGPVTLSFSGDFEGAPVEIRAVRGDDHLLKPGVARFDPDPGGESFSFTFVERPKGAGCRRFNVEWRSPSSQAVTLNHGDLVITYQHARPQGEICEGV